MSNEYNQAKQQLSLIESGYLDERARLLEEIIQAPNADTSWQAVLAVRALDEMVGRLYAILDSAKMRGD